MVVRKRTNSKIWWIGLDIQQGVLNMVSSLIALIFNIILHFFIITNWKYRISGNQIKGVRVDKEGKIGAKFKVQTPWKHAQFTRSWILFCLLQPPGLTIKPKNVCFLPKCNLRPSLVVQRSLWGPQKSKKNKPVTASFLRPLAVRDPVFLRRYAGAATWAALSPRPTRNLESTSSTTKETISSWLNPSNKISRLRAIKYLSERNSYAADCNICDNFFF